jgi:hypothetical protein
MADIQEFWDDTTTKAQSHLIVYHSAHGLYVRGGGVIYRRGTPDPLLSSLLRG